MRCGTNHTSFFSKIFVVSFRHVTLNSGFSGNFVLPGYLPVTYPDVIKKGFKRQPASQPARPGPATGHRPEGRPACVGRVGRKLPLGWAYYRTAVEKKEKNNTDQAEKQKKKKERCRREIQRARELENKRTRGQIWFQI